MTPSLGIEPGTLPGTHWWKASALTTAPRSKSLRYPYPAVLTKRIAASGNEIEVDEEMI